MREWHIVLAFGFILGYVARWWVERWRKWRARSEAYQGRWPAVVIALLALSSQACAPVAWILIPVAGTGAQIAHSRHQARRCAQAEPATRPAYESDEEIIERAAARARRTACR
jgi:predicted PurR-regulated permease PerM